MSLLEVLARILIGWIVVLFLLVPIPIIIIVDSIALRTEVVLIFSALLIAALSVFTKAKITELLVSGAT